MTILATDLFGWFAGQFPDLSSLVAQIQRGPGNYINWFKLVPVLLIYLLWVYSTNWIERDMRQLRGANELWKVGVFFAGLFGLLLAFLLPWYPVQLVAVFTLWLVPLIFYINYRNGHVKEEKWVTMSSIFHAMLAGIGIEAREEEEEEDEEGPPIRLIALGTEEQSADSLFFKVEESPALVPTKELMFDAVNCKATDVLLEPKKDRVLVRYRIDGIAMNAEPFDQETGVGVLFVLKTLAGMDSKEKRKPQQGGLIAETGGRKIEVKTSSQGSVKGERFSLRVIDPKNRIDKMSQLGMHDQMIESITGLCAEKTGFIVVSGPPQSGVSTTLFAMLREIDRFTSNVLCFTGTSEFHVDNVQQSNFNDKPDVPPAQQFRSLLRTVPDIILAHDIPDRDTADFALDAATEQLLLTAITANDAISAIGKFLDLGDRELAANVLSGVLNQRLIRRLCKHCKEAYKPKPEFLKKANIPAGKVKAFYRPPRNPEEPCPRCGGTGYMGRVGIFELLIVNDKIREMIKGKPSPNALKAEARKNGMHYLQEDGLRQVIQGITSVDELMRAFK